MTIQIVKGLPDVMRAEAARLYWEAFGSKLGKVLGPQPKALAFLELVIRADHAFIAIDDRGGLLGIAGFKTHAGSFAGGSLDDLRTVYGFRGAQWRGALLSLLASDTENQRFLLDGICVAAKARSQGVGTLLMAALLQEARSRNYSAVRLDVVDSNHRAKALYIRLGFEAVRTEHLGLLRFVFGFRSTTTMVRRL